MIFKILDSTYRWERVGVDIEYRGSEWIYNRDKGRYDQIRTDPVKYLILECPVCGTRIRIENGECAPEKCDNCNTKLLQHVETVSSFQEKSKTVATQHFTDFCLNNCPCYRFCKNNHITGLKSCESILHMAKDNNYPLRYVPVCYRRV